MRFAFFYGLLLALLSPSAVAIEKLPLEYFLKPGEFADIKISPDGKRFATTYMDETELKLRILNRETMQPEANFEFGEYHRVAQFEWVSNERLIINERKFVGFLDTKGGVPRLYASDFDGSNRGYLGGSGMASAAAGGSSFQILELLESDPDHIMVGQFSRDGIRPFRLNVKTGKKHFMGSPRMTSTESFSAGLAADHEGNLRFVIESARDDKIVTHYRQKDRDEWSILDLGSTGGKAEILPLAFSRDSSKIMLASNHDASTHGIFEYDLENGKVELLFRDPVVDANAVFSAHDNTVLGLRYMPGRYDTLWLNPEHPEARALIGLYKAFPGQEVRFTSHTRDGSESIVLVFSDTNPGEFYVYNWEKNELKFLLSRMPWVKSEQMATMEPIKVVARDGLELRGYLTLPPGSDGKNLPMVVNVHGGPHGPRDEWGFSPEVQLLANRGYAVLQINFRGSGGYGRDFEEAGYLNWGGTMQDDVTDATLWAVDQGIADRERMCIYGGSYGGYAALQGVVREPDLYKCAIGYVGVYDLEIMNACGDIPDSRRGRDFLEKAQGKDREDWARRSPARNADKIKAAIFLAHGEDDVRVPMCQGNAMKKALDEAGKDYIWMTRDEGHGYQKLENRLAFYGQMEEFLARHIGN